MGRVVESVSFGRERGRLVLQREGEVGPWILVVRATSVESESRGRGEDDE